MFFVSARVRGYMFVWVGAEVRACLRLSIGGLLEGKARRDENTSSYHRCRLRWKGRISALSLRARACACMCVSERESGEGGNGVKTACGSLANIPLTLLSPVPGFVYVGHAAGCVTRTRTSVRARRNPNQAHTTPPLFHFKESESAADIKTTGPRQMPLIFRVFGDRVSFDST